ncbi:helix-turn-helix domain-containing protein [Billgrantia bachuensis]|uniref:Helix-turn-helix domain-containing protein n=1 Tax=Billgrantia bachuensis TaxID=2717286 RepID=A0ABX0PRN2_9GAMM|nr:helix-turn-helix domain-containing protein [Halomonas bachuensis]NIC05236.1 helix-turn-helix domain-containing protein [Halomonas bachuensis]
MSEQRAFRGVWIPAHIWLNRDLSLQEKVMLIEIDSLQHPEKGCFKSNKNLAEFFDLSPNRVSEIISSLKKKGWVSVEQIREGKQIVERRIFMKRPLDKGIRKTEEGYSENDENPIRDSEEGYSGNRENPIRDSEEGYSENCVERGSGLGVHRSNPGEGTSPPGASPAAAEGDYLAAEQPEPDSQRQHETPAGESGEDLLARVPADMPGTRDPNAKTFKPWANYACAYRARYRTWPVWNQKTAAQLSQLVDRVGAELAPKCAAFFLRMNNQFYLAKVHPVSLLLADCEAIATQCTTGRQVTQAQARQQDSTQTNLSNLEQAKAMLREKRAQQEGTSCH